MTAQASAHDVDPTEPVRGTDLAAAVQGRLRRQVRDFRLVLADKGLILRGQAPSYYVKQIAQHAVMAAGLPILANEIEVVGALRHGNEGSLHERASE